MLKLVIPNLSDNWSVEFKRGNWQSVKNVSCRYIINSEVLLFYLRQKWYKIYKIKINFTITGDNYIFMTTTYEIRNMIIEILFTMEQFSTPLLKKFIWYVDCFYIRY